MSAEGGKSPVGRDAPGGNGRTESHISVRKTPPSSPCTGPYTIEEDLLIINQVRDIVPKKKRLTNFFSRLFEESAPFVLVGIAGFLLYFIPGAYAFFQTYAIGFLTLCLILVLVIIMSLDFEKYYMGYLAPDILPEIPNEESRSQVKRMLQRKDIVLLKDMLNTIADPIPEMLYVMPISRDAFPKDRFQLLLKDILKNSARIAIGVAVFLAFYRIHEPMVAVKGLLFTFLTVISAYAMNVTFHHYVVVKWPYPRYQRLRRGLGLAIQLPLAVLFIIIPITFLVAGALGYWWSFTTYYLPLLSNPLTQAVSIVPSSIMHIIMDDTPAWYFIISASLFFMIGGFAVIKLWRLDYIRSNRLLVCIGMSYKVKDIKETDPAAEDEEETSEKPYTTAWSEVDAGDGLLALETKRKILDKVERPLLANILGCLCFIIPALLLRVIVPPSPIVPRDFMILIGVGVGIMLVSIGLQPGFWNLKEQLIKLQLYPFEPSELIWSQMGKPYLIVQIDFLVTMALILLIFDKTSTELLVFFLLYLPSFFFCILMIWLSSGWEATPSNTGFTLALVSIIVPAVLSFYVYLTFGLFGLPGWTAIIASVPIYYIIGLFFMRAAHRKVHREYLRPRNWRVTMELKRVVAILILIILVLLPIAAMAQGIYIIRDLEPLKVDRHIDGYEMISDQNVQFHGSLIVPAGAQLYIRNSTVVFDILQPGMTGLYVEKAGELNVMNSTITSRGHFVFKVWAGSALTISDSVVSRTWGENDASSVEGGIVLYTRRATIRNTTVSYGLGNGITIDSASPTIQNCTVIGNSGNGIEVDDGKPFIVNNTIQGNGWGITFKGAGGLVQGNNITQNSGAGIWTDESFPDIRDNTFYHNNGPGINIESGAPALGNNTFEGNPGGEVAHTPSALPFLVMAIACILTPAIVIMSIFGRIVNKKKPKPPIPRRKK